MDAVRDARVRVGENAAVGQEGRLRGGVAQQREGVDGGRARGVPGRGGGARPRAHSVRVGDVEGTLVRGEGDAGGAGEAVGHSADVARRRLEAVHVLRQLGLGAEAAGEAVGRVGEPDGAVGVDGGGAGRVERAGVVVVQQ